MSRPTVEVADIFRAQGNHYIDQHTLGIHQLKVSEPSRGARRAYRKKQLICAGSIQHLEKPQCFSSFLRTLFRQNWVVYAKPAFGGPEHVIRYLGRYTHRVAISNHRLLSFDSANVTFRWRDYAGGNKQRS